MISIALCGLAFLLCLQAARRSLVAGLCSLIAVGYVYGIVRANFPDGFSHLIFDCGVLGLYAVQLRQPQPRWQFVRSEDLRNWLTVLMAWPILLFAVPWQDPLIQLVGLRGSIFLLPFLLLGARLTGDDVYKLALWLSVLNLLAAALGVVEFFVGVEPFFPRNAITDTIYRSKDLADYTAYRIPSSFSSAHAYAGTMVMTIAIIGGAWVQGHHGKWQARLMGAAIRDWRGRREQGRDKPCPYGSQVLSNPQAPGRKPHASPPHAPDPLHQRRQHLAALAAQAEAGNRGQLALVKVDFDQVAATAADVDGKLRRRIDGRGRPGDDHAVALFGFFEAALQDVGRNGFAERHRVALQDAAALRAAWWQLFVADLVAPVAGDALDAADQRGVAVDLGDLAAAGGDVKVVHVLRNQVFEDSAPFELDEREVPGIGLRPLQGLPQLAHRPGGRQAFFPGRNRVGEKAFVAVHRRLAVLGPQAARSSERRDAALHRQARSGQRHHVARPRQQVGRFIHMLLQRLGESVHIQSAGKCCPTRWWSIRTAPMRTQC
jgi:hypothetical protein